MISYIFASLMIYCKLWSYVLIFVTAHKHNLVLVHYCVPQPARFWELFTTGVIKEEIQTSSLPDGQVALSSESH